MAPGHGIAGAVMAISLLGAPAAAQTPEQAGWLADLDQVRDVLTTDYANLEWAAADRLSLKATYDRARTAVAAAPDEAAARTALTQFVSAFADGHLFLRWPRAAQPSGAPVAEPSPCDRLGRGGGDRDGALQRLPGFEKLPTPDSDIIPAGFVTAQGRRLGVLRIPAFGHHAFPEICDRLAAERRIGGDCDEVCLDGLGKASHAAFMGLVTRQLRALAAARPDALIVDVAQNGGGDDSAEAIARMLTPRPLSSARVGMMRTPGWTQRLDRDIADLTALRPGLAAADQATLDGILSRMRDAREETLKPCDRTPLWRDEALACSQIIPDRLSATGWVNGRDAGQVRGTPWAPWTFSVEFFPYEAGLWDGPLYVLVDQVTGSAAEQFAALLKDNGAATLIGAPTVGAGCGHWLGGQPVRLTNSGGLLSLPDCTRYRADGSNEVGGVVPDMLIPIRVNDSRRQRTARMAAALDRLPLPDGR